MNQFRLQAQPDWRPDVERAELIKAGKAKPEVIDLEDPNPDQLQNTITADIKKKKIEAKNAPQVQYQPPIFTGDKPNILVTLVGHILSRNDGKEKVLIVVESVFFLEMLKRLISWKHKMHPDDIVALHGSISYAGRNMFQQRINSDARVRVGFMTLKTGGVGLNLHGANHMIFYTSQYNPAW